MRNADLFRRRFGLPPGPDFALLNEFAHPEGDFRGIAVLGDPVLVVEIDILGLQAFQRGFKRVPESFPAEFSLRNFLAGQENGHELCRQDHVIPNGLQRLAHQLFIGIGRIHFGCVEQGAAVFVIGFAHKPDGFPFGGHSAVAVAEAHAAHADGRYFQAAFSQPSFFHDLFSPVFRVMSAMRTAFHGMRQSG